jgi:SNF2 family DNA or RNA helicase
MFCECSDEMGLGKTVTLLALLVSHRRNGIRIPRPNGDYVIVGVIVIQ